MQHGTLMPMQGYGPASYGDNFADVYDDWYHDVSDVDATVNRVAKLADGGPILELGVGTGRLAIPLAESGETVVGVDASAAMLARLKAKPGGGLVTCIEADMADLEIDSHQFSVAFAAFNTFFNLTDTHAQQRCLASVAAALRPRGRLVIEGFVPPAEGLNDGGVSVRDITAGSAVVTISTHDPEAQRIQGQHIELSTDHIRMRPWVLHYQTPEQLDAAAAAAGFELETRSADWDGAPLLPHSESHVSIYRLRSES